MSKETEGKAKEERSPLHPPKGESGKEGKETTRISFDFDSRAHARERVPPPAPLAESQSKSNDSFDESFLDPTEEVVQGAVDEFSGTLSDYRLWTWYAQRLGLNTFINAWQAQTEYVEAAAKTRWPVRNLPAAFQSQLKRLFRARATSSRKTETERPHSRHEM